ncbi:MAG: pyrroline-5-carboxylate reductase [Treponema sp.]|nr:pyrroline-5-carboxylate reductase [Treponema sp.]
MTKIACIGSGNMGFTLMAGIGDSGKNTKIKIGITDTDREKAEITAEAIGAEVFSSNVKAAEKAAYIFLAVKPPAMKGILEEIAPVVQKRLAGGNAPVVVSMAAGWTIAEIQAVIGSDIPVARIMPNTPALVSEGITALAVSPQMSAIKAAELETLLEETGEVDRIEEHYFNAVTALSGSGPAFVYMFIEALADGGVLSGLPRNKAMYYATQTVLGATAMTIETNMHTSQLKDMVCSPGGTTIAGVAALESCAFKSTVIQAVNAAWKRAEELTKNGN